MYSVGLTAAALTVCGVLFGAAAKKPAAKAELKPKPSPILFAQNSGTLHFSIRPIAILPFFTGSRKCVCMDFTVFSPSPVEKVTVTTAGLGESVLAALPTDAPCPKDVPGEKAALDVGALGPGGKRLRLYVPVSLAPEPGDEAEGKLIALAPGYEKTAAALKVKQAPSGPIGIALGWLLGIGAPAIIALLGARAAERRATRRQELDKIATYVFDNRATLDNFFGDHLKTLRENKPRKREFSAELLDALARRDFLALPQSDRAKLIGCLRKSHLWRAQWRLAHIFPEWKHQIRGKAKT